MQCGDKSCTCPHPDPSLCPPRSAGPGTNRRCWDVTGTQIPMRSPQNEQQWWWTRHRQERPWHKGVSPAPSSPPALQPVRLLQHVGFQSTLNIFIAEKCKESNETLALDAAGAEEGRGCSVVPPTDPRGPAPSPFLPHYCVNIHWSKEQTFLQTQAQEKIKHRRLEKCHYFLF